MLASMSASSPTQPDAGAPPLTVAIPNYNGRDLLEQMLPTLAAQTFAPFETLIVDDGSTDDSCEWLCASWPQVRLVEHGRNRGITAALNTCLAEARSELVALLNNDLELDPGFLAELVRALKEHPRAGSASGKLIDYHRRELLDGAGDVLLWRGNGHRRGHGEPDLGQYDRPQAIFGACAGAALYRRAALEEVGPFDESFEAYFEDVDWSLRAQLAGWECRYAPHAIAYHMGSATVGAGLGDFTRYHLWRNGPWVLAKGLPLSLVARHAHQLVLGQAINLAVAVRDRKLAIWWRALRDCLRGMPAVLRKRRALQRARRRSPAELAALIDTRDG
jgi:GT2 family glycosyltransferase